MGNEQSQGQNRRTKQEPAFCCGQEPKRTPLQEASPNIMNLNRSAVSKFDRKYSNNGSNKEETQMQQTGSTYYKDKDMSIFRKPQNNLDGTVFNQTGSTDKNNLYAGRDENSLKPITQETGNKKAGFASFKKSGYGAFNSQNNFGTFNSYGLHTLHTSQVKQNKAMDLKNHKPTPMVDYVAEKEIKQSRMVPKNVGPFVGQGKYSGKIEQFKNNKKIVQFLNQNHVKQPQFKFYDTKDNSSLLNNSTIGLAKKKYGLQQMNQEQLSTSNISHNNLNKLQDPIELNFQIDARVILATCLLALGIVIFVLGVTVFQSETSMFICLMIGISLYLGYLIMCYIFNDVFEYLFNVRTFQDFEKDYKLLRETDGQFAYHIQLQTPKKFIKQCYLLSKDNKYVKIQQVQNENRDISVNDLADKNTDYLFVKYKMKSAFCDAESQLNTVQYFDEFIEEHKEQFHQHHHNQKKDADSKSKSKTDKKSKYREQKQKQKTYQKDQKHFQHALKHTDFNYQVNQIPGLTSKPEAAYTACYMRQDDNGFVLTLFIIFTLFGLCLPFLCFFQAYTKRFRINVLNRFKVQ